jgi:hypothetical protein
VNADPVARIERTAWALGALLVAASVLLRSATVTAGVALGVLVAVLNYRYLVRFVRAARGRPLTAPLPLRPLRRQVRRDRRRHRDRPEVPVADP